MNIAMLNKKGKEKNIHPVCLICKKECKKPYSFWSFQMPPDVFCDEFEEDKGDKEELGLQLFSLDPKAISKLYNELVKRFFEPLTKRIEAEEKRLGRKLTEAELIQIIKEVCEEALSDIDKR